MIEDALDSVKSARVQIGSLSHLSEDLDHFLQALRNLSQGVAVFFSDRRHTVLVGLSIMASFSLINHLRGWIAAHKRRR